MQLVNNELLFYCTIPKENSINQGRTSEQNANNDIEDIEQSNIDIIFIQASKIMYLA